MDSVAIFGVGLIGGSFGLALRAAGFQGRIAGVSSPATIARAVALGAIDQGLPAEEAAASADLVFLAQPIRVILETIPGLAGHVSPGALVTDAGSTKRAIMDAALRELPGALFVGGHPMAGKELRGVGAASPDLFRGRIWILTPARAEDIKRPQYQAFSQWVERIGAVPLILDAAAHDRTVAFTSHLPQMASTALAATLAEQLAGTQDVRGPGLEDMTRLALSSWEIWADILATNRANIAEALDLYSTALAEIRRALGGSQEPELRKVFERAGNFARPLRDTSNRPPE